MAKLGETVAALAAQRWPASANDPGGAALSEVVAFGDNPGRLRMLVHAPAGRAAGAALVVVLHGCTQTAAGYAQGAGWIELAERYGFVLLCPEQTRGNNVNLCFNWFQDGDTRRGEGEAASIHAMVRRALGDYDLDPARVFATGLSAGGAMANVMLAAYPETFAAGAIIAGLPYGVASNMTEAFAAMRHARALPPAALGEAVRSASGHLGTWPRISIWQGDEDATVKAGVADDLVSQWRNVHGLDAAAPERRVSGVRREAVWRDARGEGMVELHQFTGMGHGTPIGRHISDGCGAAGPYLLEIGVSSTLEIAQSWGLTGPGPTARSADHSASTGVKPATAAAPRGAGNGASPLPPLRTVTSEIGGIITDALRSAGLMR